MKCELKNICQYRIGKVLVNTLDNKNYVSTENMLPDKRGIQPATSLPNTAVTQRYCVGDVLVSNIRPYFKKIYFAKNDGGCSNDVLVFQPLNDVEPQYLYYVLANDEFFAYCTASSKGTKMPRGDKGAIMQYKVNLPDLETQKKIAKVLSALDDKIELNNQINKNLEEQANRIVKEYCQSVSSNVRLSKILSFVNGFAFQSKSYVANGRYRVITIKNVKDGEIDSNGAPFVDCLPISMKQECILGIGDVLVSLTGNVGRVGIVYESDLLLNQRVAKIVPYDMNLLPFLYFYFRMESTKISLETIAKGTAQQNLSTIETLKLELPYNDSIKEMSKRLKFLFETIVTNQRQNKVLSELRETLLPKLMSGEIDVDNVEI